MRTQCADTGSALAFHTITPLIKQKKQSYLSRLKATVLHLLLFGAWGGQHHDSTELQYLLFGLFISLKAFFFFFFYMRSFLSASNASMSPCGHRIISPVDGEASVRWLQVGEWAPSSCSILGRRGCWCRKAWKPTGSTARLHDVLILDALATDRRQQQSTRSGTYSDFRPGVVMQQQLETSTAS